MQVIKATEANREDILKDSKEMVQRRTTKPFEPMLNYCIRLGEFYIHYSDEDGCTVDWYSFHSLEWLRKNCIYEMPQIESEWFQATRYSER